MEFAPEPSGEGSTLTLTLALLSGTARAQTHATSGQGTAACGFWTGSRHHAVASNVEQWTLGFLSGVADAAHGRLDPLHKTDDQAVWNWIDNYCKAHPLDLIANAAGKLINRRVCSSRHS